MGLLDFLFGRTPKLTDEAPEITITVTLRDSRGWTPDLETPAVLTEETALLDHASDVPSPARKPFGGKNAWADKDVVQTDPLFCMIDYVDAGGQPSRRRVTIRRVIRDGDRLWLGAYCHERNASRTFRADRIANFITSDGEVFAAAQFLADFLGVDMPGEAAVFPCPQEIRQSLTDHLRPALTILVAAARSDLHVHLEETDAILVYAEHEAYALVKANRLSRLPDLETFDALKPRLDTMRPVQSDVAQALLDVLDWDDTAFRRLGRALENVIYADGHLRDAEVQFVDELLALRRQDADGRHRGVFAHVDRIGLEKRQC